MTQYLPLPAAFVQFVESLSAELGDQLKQLLETKHLYQKVTIDLPKVIAEVEKFVVGDEKKQFELGVASKLKREPPFPADTQLSDGENSPLLVLLIRNVKLFCSNCDAREVYLPVWYTDITNEMRAPRFHGQQSIHVAMPQDFQLLSLIYQCQNCKGQPEAFLVRRDGWNLFLEGRSPMEHVELPQYIPKSERALYRDALVAIHAGKTLAALFYLRTFIEQFARRLTGQKSRITGDELMDAYMALLPAKQRDLIAPRLLRRLERGAPLGKRGRGTFRNDPRQNRSTFRNSQGFQNRGDIALGSKSAA
jgi:hypothetical protein